MSIELQRLADQPLAQQLRIGDHVFTVDATEPEGGSEAGPSPHDLYDAALGACKAITVLWYARRKGIPVEHVETHVERDASQERAGTYRLAATLRIRGALSEAQLQELATVAGKCPVHKLMTAVTTEISTAVERLP